jgi:hypothetical protein
MRPPDREQHHTAKERLHRCLQPLVKELDTGLGARFHCYNSLKR